MCTPSRFVVCEVQGYLYLLACYSSSSLDFRFGITSFDLLLSLLFDDLVIKRSELYDLLS